MKIEIIKQYFAILYFDTEKDKIELLGRVSINNGNQIITSTKESWIIKMKKLHS